MLAFHGDPDLKDRLIQPLRSRWVARELIPASILRWDIENNVRSLCGAIIESQDRDQFEQVTGIPLEMAMLCEAMIASNIDVTGDPLQPAGFTMDGSDEIMSFGLEWLDAVRPGSDLSGVLPGFMVQWLSMLLETDFALAKHVEPDVRATAARILGLWHRELAGEAVPPKEWSSVRRAAVEANESVSDPWCLGIASAIETLAWPLRSIASEFVSTYLQVAVGWLGFLQAPFLSEQDRADQVHELIGWLRMAQASRQGEMDEAATMALLDSIPDSKRALFNKMDPVFRERVRAAKRQARTATDPVVRSHMNLMLALIKAA